MPPSRGSEYRLRLNRDTHKRIAQTIEKWVAKAAKVVIVAKGSWSSISNSKRYCPICLGNHIGDEKHYIHHWTNVNFIETRKSFVMELYKINTNNSLINSSPMDIIQWILSGKLMKEMSETGKFLNLMLELAEKLLREADM